jgi:hypothetical protein
MKKIIVSIFLSLLILALVAQNFSVVQPGRDYFYSNSERTVAVRVDSISVIGNDTEYHQISMFRDTANSFDPFICVDVFGGTLLGKKNIITQSGVFQIPTFRHDTVTILPEAQLNDTWKMFQWGNGSYIEASITGISHQTVLNQVDQVKTITLTVKDQNNNPLAGNPFHLKQLKLAENFGLIQTFDFYLFPTDTTTYYLEGITNPEAGYIMTPRTIFDFNVGDEFHYREKSVVLYGWYTNEIWQGYTQLAIKTITGKTFSIPDTAVTYEYQLCSRLITYHQLIPDTTFSVDTLTETIIFHNPADTTFHQLPWQTFPDKNCDDFIFICPIIEQYNNTPLNRKLRVYYDRTDIGFQDTCWHLLCVDPAPGIYYYFDGLGGPYYFVDSWSILPIKERKLLYYKKGSETWGIPIGPSCESLINTISELNKPEMKIYPNPATDVIFIENLQSETPDHIIMADITGRIVYQSSFSDRIDVSHLPKGMYLLSVYTNTGKFVRKIIVQ